MEQKNRSITWADIKARVEKLDKTKKYYGVPRGGQYIAALLNPVDTPEEADYIIDDLVDSGATKDKWLTMYPDKPFIGLFQKSEFHCWLEFPWEKKGEIEIEENVLRILEYFDDPTREGLKETPKRYIKFYFSHITCFYISIYNQMPFLFYLYKLRKSLRKINFSI